MHKKPGRNLNNTTIGGIQKAGLGLTALCYNASCNDKKELDLLWMTERQGCTRKFAKLKPKCSQCGKGNARIIINWENYGPTAGIK